MTDGWMTLREVCEELSISVATGRNWIRLGKLHPSRREGAKYLFSDSYVQAFKGDVLSGKNKALKSRRNKSFVSGSEVYGAYISPDSANVEKVQKLLSQLDPECLGQESRVMDLLAEAAMRLLLQRLQISSGSGESFLEAYLTEEVDLNGYGFLIEDLIVSREESLRFIQSHRAAFGIDYFYEAGEDVLGFLYLSCRCLGNRKATGSYYTPTGVVKQLIDGVYGMNQWQEDATVCDPCCGTGNFLLQLPPEVRPEQIYGNDIDPVGIKVARINMALKYQICDRSLLCTHIVERNTLFEALPDCYDIFVGNPPWGYCFRETERDMLKESYCSAAGKGVESSDLFVEYALAHLKKNGVVSFVLPETIMNVRSHRGIRQYIIDRSSVQSVQFLGNVFDKVQCPCVILQMMYTGKSMEARGIHVKDKCRSFEITDGRKISADGFHFNITDEESAVLQKLQSVPGGICLKEKAVFALGIVTGNNQQHLLQEKTDQNEMILRGTDIFRYRYEKADTYITYEPERFQQCAPTVYYRAPEKLIYRFIASQPVFAYDDKGVLTLNSANIVIPRVENLNMKYIMAVLNSGIAQFYFSKQFHSVKILREHIEQMPIPVVGLEEQARVIEKVDRLLGSGSDTERLCLYNEIDLEIGRFFMLRPEEYQIIRETAKEDDICLGKRS